MATPALKLLSQALTINRDTPQSFKILTMNPDGTPLDVSSGYAVDTFRARAASDLNPESAVYDLAGSFTYSYDATGVTCTLSSGQAQSLAALFKTLHNEYLLSISNDSGSTQSVLSAGSLSVNPFSGLL